MCPYTINLKTQLALHSLNVMCTINAFAHKLQSLLIQTARTEQPSFLEQPFPLK